MIQKLSIFAADIDGTLVEKGGHLMPRTKANMQRLHKEGVLIGIASGRPLDKAHTINKSAFWDLGFEFDFAIGMNGGDLWTKETDEIEHFYQLSAENVRKIVTFMMPIDCNIIVYEKAYDLIRARRVDNFILMSQARNHSYVEYGGIDFLSENATGKIEVQCHPRYENLIKETIAKNPSPDWTTMVTYRDEDHYTIEFMDPRIGKGLALEMYAKRRGIPLSEVMAFGDLENDISLLEKAGWSVCLKNGSDETKAVANAVTDYNVAMDGVGRYLDDHWFRGR